MIPDMPDLGVIRIDIDPVIHLGPVSVHWYGVMYAVAFLVAFTYGVLPHVIPRGITRSTAERLCTWTIIWGLVGARLYYVVQQPNLGDFISNPIRIIAVWEGGMAFFGAIIASLATITWFSWRHRLPLWVLLDAGAIFAVVGQPIGRIGNLVNGDILGSPSDLPWATAYVNPHAILQPCCRLGVAYQPAAAYEALATICIGVILFLMRRRGVRAGALVVSYLPLYAVSQIIVFFFRASEPAVLLGLRQAQWTGIGMLVIASPALWLIWRRGIDTARPAAGAEAQDGAEHHADPASDEEAPELEPKVARTPGG